MALRVYNVRTRRLEEFKPLHPGHGPGQGVGVYVCGLTVYDHMHIGHARTALSFEVIRRWLEHRARTEGWGPVKFVQNVTDVDDKIIQRAAEQGKSPRELADFWDKECAAQVARLGVRPPDEAPHVTTSIPDIIRFIQAIVANGYAYATADGNVYFDVPKYDAHAATHLKDAAGHGCGYGSLSNRDYKQMAAGTRKEVEADKKHPADFALWKADEPGNHPDAAWDSPWGRGRPGWHIECSLMSTRSLGDRLDIHGGGQDLIFPHHENEIAQSQAKTGKAPFVNVWLHSGFLNVEGEKMSKSLQNFITLKEKLDEMVEKHGPDAGPEALRFYYLQTHYRSKIDFSDKGLGEAAEQVNRLTVTRQQLAEVAAHGAMGCAELDVPLADAGKMFERDFDQAMDDDFHSPKALAALSTFQRAIRTAIDSQAKDRPLGKHAAAQALAQLQRAAATLTLATVPIDRPATITPQVLELARALRIDLTGARTESDAAVAVFAARDAARAAKDWKRSDEIRTSFRAIGVLIEDTPAGQRWRRA